MANKDGWVRAAIGKLSLRQKLGQLLTVPLNGDSLDLGGEELERAVSLVREHGVGAFVLYGGVPSRVVAALNRLQSESLLPLLFSADFEGGPGQVIKGATEFPPNMAFGAAGSAELMYEAATVYAKEGRALGIHLTYAPVVDISLNPSNPAESGRSFGANLDLLDKLVSAYVKGCHDQGLLTTAKHFPGRGNCVPVPGRSGWIMLDKDQAALEENEFRAFQSAIRAGVDFVMTEHIAIPSLTGGSDEPASVEPLITKDWLRNRLGFQGVITSDDLWYDHVITRYGAEEVVARSLEAGHDAILKPRDPIASIEFLVTAVESGRIPVATIDGALERILRAKASIGLNDYRQRFVDPGNAERIVGCVQHRQLARRVADLSVTTLRGDDDWLDRVVERATKSRKVNINIFKDSTDPGPIKLNAALQETFPDFLSIDLGPSASPADRAFVLDSVQQGDLVILSLFVQRDKYGDPSPLREVDRILLQSLARTHPTHLVAMSYGNPHILSKLPDTIPCWLGYGERSWFGNQEVYFESFIDLLLGRLKPSGRLPIAT